ncbi:alkene reductase [Actinocrinis sp.]|uniref:alkene reductase n=1 Tax=Actinocrinis sp. TaxID=1920516 RepID=UPI002D58F62B|nr:alkene reductase [Actinocrinis sp.]HZP50524.1 alkene reductase [Actinocrinis sp.]
MTLFQSPETLNTSALFDEVTIGDLKLANRLVMAPLTRSRANADGTANALMAEHYSQRAAAGLIVSESAYVSAQGKSAIKTPGLHTDAHIASWRQVTDVVHARGGRIFAQLVHAGRVSHHDLQPDGGAPVAPSRIAARAKTFTASGMVPCPVPRPLTGRQIQAAIGSFAHAAQAAAHAGFDGIELHAGNGYLVNQFLDSAANQRSDRYGGSVANRIRFALEALEAAAGALGPQRVGIRIAPWNAAFGMEPDDDDVLYPELVRSLPSDLAYLHVREVGDRPLTQRLRELWRGPLILNPHPGGPEAGAATVEQACQALSCGMADAVCLGTLFLANPDLPARIAAGGPYNEPDPTSFYQGGAAGYIDYPPLVQPDLTPAQAA